MNYEPKEKNKTADALCFAALFCAVLLLGFSAINGISGKWVLQAMSLVFFGVMIFSLVRYKFTYVRYEIVPFSKNEDAPVVSLAPSALELRIYRRQGKCAFIAEFVCDLDKIVSCAVLPKSGKLMRAAVNQGGKDAVFKYVKNMVGGDKVLLTVKNDSSTYKVVLEINDDGGKFLDYLSAVARYNSEKE